MSTFTLDDTIVAISTPIGQGGIGIVRLSGAQALAIARELFRPLDAAWPQHVESHRLYYGHITNPQDGCVVDEVLLSYMQAPRTFTREDVVEINAHGGLVPLQTILSLCLSSGARLAHEGEFTLRAFLNGRIDLTQAEAVLDVINAKTEASLRIALGQLGGQLSAQVREIRSGLLSVLAYLEASVDFPDEDLPAQDIAPDLAQASGALEALVHQAHQGMLYRQGVRTAIVGRPNVGKSSLLNALLRTDRAIVTPIPGTTRDTLEETINLQGIPFVLIDTAGINDSVDLIERMGVKRSQASLRQADLILFILDGSVSPDERDGAVAAMVGSQPRVVVHNKSDLGSVGECESLFPESPHIALSALTGEGMPLLEQALVDAVLGGQVLVGGELVISNPRHRNLLEQARRHVEDARSGWREDLPIDLLTIDVGEAIQALGQVTGEDATEDLLDTIFANFCIGK